MSVALLDHGEIVPGLGAVAHCRPEPARRLGTPPMPADRALSAGVVAVILGLGVFLPMAGLTLLAAMLADLLVGMAMRLRATA